MVNKSLGRYQVLRLLSKSGTNQVFLGRAIEGGEADYHAVRWIQDSAFEGARRAAWLRTRAGGTSRRSTSTARTSAA